MNKSILTLPSRQGKAMKILLAIVAVIVIIIGLAVYFTSGLTGPAREQLATLKAGNIDAAYNMTSAGFKDQTSLEEFKKYVDKQAILTHYKSFSFLERRVDNGLGYLSGEIEDADGKKMKIEYQLVKEDGKWKIQAMRLSELQ